MCFTDYRKAFDHVKHIKIWTMLRKMGIPEHLIVFMKDPYTGQEATIQIEYEETDCFHVSKEMRQGSKLSPYIFNLYAENILREVGLEVECGSKSDGRIINNLNYSDYSILIAENANYQEALVIKVKRHSENGTKKTK